MSRDCAHFEEHVGQLDEDWLPEITVPQPGHFQVPLPCGARGVDGNVTCMLSGRD